MSAAPLIMDVKGVRFSDEILAKLAEPFPETDVLLDRTGIDGFQPSYIPWDKITQLAREKYALDEWNLKF